ncbi:AAA family ATPase [Sciscionella sediminilitoris]|uniref:AAA family ATPase n=1 Tax=Sciscionella sediminilitoris TaxID=1445613 RepID=UPI0004DF786B|nr:AAA family ATPase [Sciscionella sp. SE31]
MAPVLVWINGPFGGGKTQTAFELHRRLPGSIVSDPELIGFGIHRMLPRGMRRDFQEFPAWRTGVREVLDHLLRAHAETDQVIIVPMTLVVGDYFEEIIGKLRAEGHDVRHFALLARPETVRRRLRSRGTPLLRADSWALSQVDRCLNALADKRFAEHLYTDELPIPQVADRIAAGIGRTLLPASGSFRNLVERAKTGIRHIRLG